MDLAQQGHVLLAQNSHITAPRLVSRHQPPPMQPSFIPVELEATSLFASLPWACCCALLLSLLPGRPLSLTVLSTTSFGLAILSRRFSHLFRSVHIATCLAAAVLRLAIRNRHCLYLLHLIGLPQLCTSVLPVVTTDLLRLIRLLQLQHSSFPPICATELIASLPPSPGFLLFLALLLLGSTALLHWSLILLQGLLSSCKRRFITHQDVIVILKLHRLPVLLMSRFPLSLAARAVR
mmetsp:Transcript_12128/g.18654  ORF Transcript_12128/g.18654 Transcript_12128/m.18654 type:complete len:236 (+) Transcript_12128:303-1010(+)